MITSRDVCVTPDYPRGIWQVDNVPVANLVTVLKDHAGQSLRILLPEIATRMNKTDRQVQTAIDWLRSRNVLHTGDTISL